MSKPAATMIVASIAVCLSACGISTSPTATPVPRTLQPTAWLAETLAARDAPPRDPDPDLPPVVLVHGIDGSSRDMSRLARALRATGRCVHAIDLSPNDGSATIEQLSGQLASFVAKQIPDGRHFDLAGYSMGGIVARHYLQERGGHSRVRRFVSISSPHNGTLVACMRTTPGARQMRIGSELLKHLSQAESMAKLPPTTSFQTITDLIIIPFTSSTLPGAQNVRLFGWGHFTGIIEVHAIHKVVQAINQA